MEKQQTSPLTFESVQLLECYFGDIRVDAERKHRLGLTEFRRVPNEADLKLKVVLGFDLTMGIQNPACRFTCKFELGYNAKDAAAFDTLKDHIAVAHAVPYVREFIWNITMRTAVSAAVLDPVNALRLVNDFHARKASSPSESQNASEHPSDG